MEKLFDYLCKWIDGANVYQVKKPALYVLNELLNIYEKKQDTTICQDTVEILQTCGIKTKECGIGWKIEF